MDVNQVYEMCRASTYKIIPEAKPELLEDIVQEAMLILIESEARLGYLRETKHAVVDAIRNILGDSRQKKHGVEIPTDYLANTIQAIAPSYEDEYIFYEWLLSNFKGTGKSIARLMLEGYAIKEIASMYGCSIANVHQVLKYNVVKEKKKH